MRQHALRQLLDHLPRLRQRILFGLRQFLLPLQQNFLLYLPGELFGVPQTVLRGLHGGRYVPVVSQETT